MTVDQRQMVEIPVTTDDIGHCYLILLVQVETVQLDSSQASIGLQRVQEYGSLFLSQVMLKGESNLLQRRVAFECLT